MKLILLISLKLSGNFDILFWLLSKLNNSDENKSILSLLFFFKFNIGFLILVCFLISIIRDLYSSKQENWKTKIINGEISQ